MESTNITNLDPFKTLSDLCKEPFWNVARVWAMPEPNLGPCVERTVLVWAPCVLLWACGLPSLLLLKRRRYNPIPWTAVSCTKVMVSVLALAVAATELAWAATAGSQVAAPADFIAPVVLLATQVLHISLVLMGRRKGQQNSGIIWFYWLFTVMCGLPQLYTSIIVILRRDPTSPPFLTATFLVQFLCSVALLLANCFSDALSLTQKFSATENPAPVLHASFLNRLFFFWGGSIVWLGWRRPLTFDDLWDVEPENTTASLAAQWDAAISRDGKTAPAEVKEPGKLRPAMVPVSGRQRSVLWCLVRIFRWPFLGGGVLCFVAETSRFLTPQLLSLIINFMTTPEQPAWYGYLFSVLLLASCVLVTVLKNSYFYVMFTQCVRIRSAIMTAVYRKALSLSSAARRDSTVGEIVNLMAVDSQYIGDTGIMLWSIVSSPTVILISMVFLWQELGPSILAGVGVLVLLVPVNSYLANKMKSLLFSTLKFRDQRVKMVSEIISGIKVLKLYAWEGSFAAKVEEIRAEEIVLLKKVAFYKTFNSLVFNSAPYLVALATFTTFLLASPENVLDAKKAFVSISLFNLMRLPLIQLPNTISQVIQANVALQRVQKFISAADLDPTSVCRDRSEANAIAIRGGKFSWEGDEVQSAWQLENIDLEVSHGKLVAVVGSVGAGKSSLISALLGEMKKEAGGVVVNGRVAYVSQQAWLQNATLRDNIIWGEDFDAKRYKKVVKACALQPDLDMLPGGDMTEIGEKGINLSGGQKQRVSLARAAYSGADIVLFDDPLSAVDAHVGRFIFDNVIGPQGLLQDRTRLLVTHAVTFLPRVDEVVVMEGGRVVEKGSYAELVAKQGDFANFVLQHINDTTGEEADEEIEELIEPLEQVTGAEPLLRQLSLRSSRTSVNNIGSETDIRGKRIRSISETVTSSVDRLASLDRRATKLSSASLNRKTGRQSGSSRSQSYANGLQASRTSIHSGKSEAERMAGLEEPLCDGDGEEGEFDGKRLVEDETAETGKVSRKMYLVYGKSMGVLYAILPIIFMSLAQASIAGSNIWLSFWSSTGESSPASNATSFNISTSLQDFNTSAHNISGDLGITTNDTGLDTEFSGFVITKNIFIGVYAAFGVGQVSFMFLAMMMLFLGCLRSSRVLHQRLLDSVVRLPLSFFDTNPSGRIINRFSKEVSVLDTTLPDSTRFMLSCITQVVSTLIIILAATPEAGFFMIPIMVVYYMIHIIYIASSRQLKRIESVSKSPIYSHFGETLQGVSVIRAYKKEQEFYDESQRKIESSLKAVYVNVLLNRWVAVSLEMLANLITFAAALMGVAGRGSINSGVVGLSITYALNVTVVLNWVVRVAADLEANIVSVERISEYMQKDREADWTVADTPASWPDEGCVSFRNYQTRYRPGLDLVLKGITCSFKPGEKVGIVGRTGAGKSSLTLALFRIIEAAGGEIDVDKVNIADVGLHDLRGRVSIIPQDPVLFSGPLRLNLDPLASHSDADIWRALELAHLAEYIRGQALGLEHPVDEEGSNFSVGQRQLVCLARALLRNSRILVLDEATAAIDLETDDLIQATIRSQFAHCTVLTIAHRLNTIMDSDRVLVLDQGKIAEFAPPSELLANHDSIFFGMAKDAGLV
ncbi:ATP-binding cassette sub-family C member 3-like [Penaeus chinensis]|uniref:ATP-binding cassette sub-family C member 3-like n=1 Tax=Penaeus chinensis TaxID=139456 RepID=UPI001FB84A49|nr:ATP-binding cassette sub-family C member 3-like [Penaeus chinensis]